MTERGGWCPLPPTGDPCAGCFSWGGGRGEQGQEEACFGLRRGVRPEQEAGVGLRVSLLPSLRYLLPCWSLPSAGDETPYVVSWPPRLALPGLPSRAPRS